MNIFVTKLSSNTTGDDLHELFGGYGEVTSAKVIIDRDTGRSKGYGFVEMEGDEEGNRAIEELNESEFKGNTIVVKVSKPRENNRGGGDRRGYGRDRY
jgi:RNA recognition motif-containing protein